MFPYPLGIITIVQGLYTLIAIAIAMDVFSPTLDLRQIPEWSGPRSTLALLALASITVAFGAVMHTLSRNVFRRRKHRWALEVLLSPSARSQLETYASQLPACAPGFEDVLSAEGDEQIRRGGEFVNAIDHVLMSRQPAVFRSLEVYRDQYRLARGFILPSVALALILPFWAAVPSGHLGSLPLIGIQLFFLAVLFAGVSMYSFRERTYRYTAARVRSYVTLLAGREGLLGRESKPVAAVG